MRILSHYFVARFLVLFSTVLLAALILLATVELVLNLDSISSLALSGPDPSAADASLPDPASSLFALFGPLEETLRYLGVRLASYYLVDLLPIASFAAAFVTLAWAGRAMELVAIQAGGIRLGRVVLPSLGTALILSLASAILPETAVLRAQQIWNAKAHNAAGEIDFARESFWHHSGATITNVSKADPATRTLFGVEVFERGGDGSVVRVIRAPRVKIAENGIWNFENASVWRFDPDHSAAAPRFDEEVSMALPIGSDASTGVRGDALLGAEPSLLRLGSLARYLRSQSDEAATTSHRRLVDGYHRRLSQPWLVLLFAFLAMPFALRVDQTGRIVRPAIQATAFLGLFFFLRNAGSALAQQELLPLGVTPWLLIALFTLATAAALRKSRL